LGISEERIIIDGTDGAFLDRDENGLFLGCGDQKIRGDFSKMVRRIKQANLERELLIKASRIKGHNDGLTAVDATAGLGEDSLLLAAAGFCVTLYEKDPVIAALLEDAMNRAKNIPELSQTVSRMTLIKEDSISAMRSLDIHPDVILLDPMFPERQKSALVGKKFQLIHLLEKPCEDETELLNAAVMAHPRKIIIKRPLKGTWLGGRKPDYSINGKAIRYDCIVMPPV